VLVFQILASLPIQKASQRRLEAQSAYNAIVNDSLQNTGTVIAYSLEKTMEDRYMTAFDTYYKAVIAYIIKSISLILVGIVASVAPLLVIIGVSAHQVIEGTITIAAFTAFISLASEAGNWLMMFSQRLRDVKEAAAGAERMNALLDGEKEDITSGEGFAESDLSEETAIRLDNLTFSYGEEGSASVLTDVSLAIPRGAKVALVGGSGSGKSTIVKLLLGLYEPGGGSISIWGRDAATLSKQARRGTFAYVPQDSHLFPETIGENITGESDYKIDVKLQAACRDAGILDFINSLPGGFNATLSESAENVSGGQKQRIAMARAFYQDAPIILFDEATSALDPATEAEIFKSLASAGQGKTILMVAHRASAVAFCDNVVTLEGGRVK
jgi:ABC-type bacteriocin/lantibiotic exporter with double-glycine peptidase domain